MNFSYCYFSPLTDKNEIFFFPLFNYMSEENGKDLNLSDLPVRSFQWSAVGGATQLLLI